MAASWNRAPRFRARFAAALCMAGGLIGVGAFPRYGIWPLAFLSVTALSLAVDGRRARTGGWLGLLYGLAFFIPVISWTGVYVGPMPWLILALGEAAFCAALGAGLTVLQRFHLAPLWIGSAWVLQEALRGRIPFGGFPWARLAFSQAESPMRWFAALGGAPFVTFAVAFGGGGLAVGLRQLDFTREWRSRWRMVLRGPLTGFAAASATVLVGVVLAWPLQPSTTSEQHTATIALIQGNVPDIGLDFESRPREVLDNHVAETLKLAEEIKAGTVSKPSLILWPENASDLDPFTDTTTFTEIDNTVKAIGVPILVGAILDGPGANHRRNVGILWSPVSGPGSEYTKRHPVPFGEYIPLRSISRLVSSDTDLVTQDMVAGTGNGLVTGGPFPIGDVICFEVAYDDLVRSSVEAGAQLLVVQTNNATFGKTAETYQQLAMSQLRAVENGRTVAQVATTGKSAVIGADGTIIAESHALYTADAIIATVPLRTSSTLATRLGTLPECFLAGLALAGIGWAVAGELIRRRTRRRAELPAPPARTDHPVIDDQSKEAATT